MVFTQDKIMLIKASRQFANAFRYSRAGFSFLVRSELAARMELYTFIIAIILYTILKAPFVHFIIGGVLLFLILPIEAINTAIEVIIDRISPEISETGKRAKDLGSFAVMCLIFINGIHLCYVLSITLAPDWGVKILAWMVVAFFVAAAGYTKLTTHDPRNG